MKLSEYQDLYRRLSTAEDIDFLAENFGHDKELLLVIYTQRIVRETTKKFYRVKAQARRLAFMWQNGESLLGISRKFEFPAILTALMVLVFLGSLRATAGVFLSIPLSALATFIALYAGGSSINTMILAGLALVDARVGEIGFVLPDTR